MLTVYEDTDNIFNALAAGASGYLLKRTKSAELLEAIREVHRGGSPMTTHIARKVTQSFQKTGPSPQPTENLSEREQEVLDCLSNGFLYKEIADKAGHQLRDGPHLHPPHLREAPGAHPDRGGRQVPQGIRYRSCHCPFLWQRQRRLWMFSNLVKHWVRPALSPRVSLPVSCWSAVSRRGGRRIPFRSPLRARLRRCGQQLRTSDFHQAEAFADWNLPWGCDLGKNWNAADPASTSRPAGWANNHSGNAAVGTPWTGVLALGL